MTLPLDALANNPYAEDDVPTWRKAQNKTAAAQQNASTVANSPYSATALTNPGDLQQSRLQNTQQLGTQATASAQQGATIRKQIWNNYQNQVTLRNQQIAQQQYQQSTNDYIKQLQQQYIDQAKQIPGQQQYYDPQQAPSVSGASGQPVQYSGQASQIAQMARNAGFPEAAIPTVVAISQAESSGRADAVNNANSNGTSDFGLMQINSVHSDLLSKNNWRDPQQNLNMAFQIYKDAGGSFSPWSTYNSGAYNQFMGMGRTAASAHVTPSQPINPYVAQTTSGLRKSIITKAETYIGLPYVWGGTDLSKGVDCSGLVQQVYKQFGINMPRVSADQSTGHLGSSTYGVRTSVSNLEPGDLVYFYHSDGQVHHIAIWLGQNQILEAPHTGANVRIRTLGSNDKPYGLHLYGLDPSQPQPQQQGNRTGASSAV